MKEIRYDDLDDLQMRTLDTAADVMFHAYDPYSGFRVGAALATTTGRIFCGVNVANAASGSTICAERSAICHAYSEGARIFRCMAIIARGRDFDTKSVTGPCGACRQMMYEMSEISDEDQEFTVIMSTTRKDKIVIASMEGLLPLPFGPRDLGVDISKERRHAIQHG